MSVRHALLALLSEGPKYGLQLRHEFEARTGEVWPLNVGQVYTTLQRLERDALVEWDGGEGGDGAERVHLGRALAVRLRHLSELQHGGHDRAPRRPRAGRAAGAVNAGSTD